MSLLNKLHTLIILLAVLLGLILAQVPLVAAHAASFIIPFLMLMLYGLFLAMPLQGLMKGFRHRKFVLLSLAINFVWTPLLAYLLGYVFLSSQQALWVGFVMLMVTPCTDWYTTYGLSRVGVLGKSGAHKVMLMATVAFNIRKYMRNMPKKSVSMATAMEREQPHAPIFSCWLTPVAYPQTKR